MKHLLILILFISALNLQAAAPATRSLSAYLIEFSNLSPYPVFFIAAETDATEVTVSFPRDSSLEALQRICREKGFKVSFFDNKLYVTKNSEIVTQLPDLYADISDETVNPASASTIIARSEYKIYDAGNPTGNDSSLITVRGTIRDFKTGNVVPGASIQVIGQRNGSSSNAQGSYSLYLRPGTYELLVSGMGIHATRRHIRLFSSAQLDIETEEQVFEINELTILSARSNKVKDTGMGVERLRMREIKNIPSVFGETDVLKAVLTLPGVKSGGELSGGFNVRGSATDQNLVLLNHNTIYNPTHLFGLLSAFNPDLSDNMELYMSNIPVKYGGRIASVLDVSGRSGNTQKIKGSVSLGLLTSRIAFEGPIGSSTRFAIGARASYSDWMLRLIPANSGYNEGSAGFYDLNALVNHRFSNRSSLQLHAYHSSDRFNFEPTEQFSYTNQNFSASFKREHTYRLFGTYTLGYDNYNNAIENTENKNTAFQLSTQIRQVFVRTDFDWFINPKHSLNFGLHSIFYHLNPGNLTPGSKQSIVVPQSLQTDRAIESAVYLGDEWTITEALALNAGVRFSHYQLLGPRSYFAYMPGFLPSELTISDTIQSNDFFQKNYQGPEFRFSARYIISDDLSVKAGVSSMRQYIHKISNATVMSPTDTWKLSDRAIRPQQGMQFAAGIYKNFLRNQLITSAEFYYKLSDNYLDYRSGAKLVMNPHLETEVTETSGKAYGVEVSVKKPGGKLNGWISYTWSKSLLRQDDPLMTNPVNRGDWFVSDVDKPHDFKAIANYKFTQRYSISSNFLYTTGRPVTLPVAKYKFAGGEYVYYSNRNEFRLPDFLRIDASFNVEPGHHLKRVTHSMFSLGIYNLTGRKNVYSIFFKPHRGSLQGYQLSIFGTPIPYLSYTLKF